MSRIKKIIRFLLGNYLYQNVVLIANYNTDRKLYKKHSTLFFVNTFEKIECEIVLRYHSIEKGFLHDPIRFKFGENKIKELIVLLKKEEVLPFLHRTQIQAGINSLCKYYEYHKINDINISEFFSQESYVFFKGLLINDENLIKRHTATSFFSKKESNFIDFSSSRCSIRNFTGEKIEMETLHKVVNLANNAPSVCNRQPVSVHLVDNKNLIINILSVQKGLEGYSKELSQLMVVTCDRSYFYSTGERNQMYIDGGIYLMNLLYALHYYEVGACPAHWGMPVSADSKIKDLLKLNESEQVIALLAIGVPQKTFSTTLSPRKTYKENLILHV